MTAEIRLRKWKGELPGRCVNLDEVSNRYVLHRLCICCITHPLATHPLSISTVKDTYLHLPLHLPTHLSVFLQPFLFSVECVETPLVFPSRSQGSVSRAAANAGRMRLKRRPLILLTVLYVLRALTIERYSSARWAWGG